MPLLQAAVDGQPAYKAVSCVMTTARQMLQRDTCYRNNLTNTDAEGSKEGDLGSDITRHRGCTE
jgi:hypothetical protein